MFASSMKEWATTNMPPAPIPPPADPQKISSAQFHDAARAYVKLREMGQNSGNAYRRLRKAWVAMVRAERILDGR